MFEGEKVRLRSLELSDLDTIMEFWNNLDLRHNVGYAFPDSKQNREEFIRNSWKLRKEGKAYIFAIERKDTMEFLGHVSIYIHRNRDRSADLGIMIYNLENWDKGFGTDAMKVILVFGFEYRNLHRIELSVYPDNKRAIHVYKKLGFKEIGRKREARFMNGKYRDEVIMDILQREWRKKND
jgi:RimJ/RimL family protein N-acetyltransferase